MSSVAVQGTKPFTSFQSGPPVASQAFSTALGIARQNRANAREFLRNLDAHILVELTLLMLLLFAGTPKRTYSTTSTAVRKRRSRALRKLRDIVPPECEPSRDIVPPECEPSRDIVPPASAPNVPQFPGLAQEAPRGDVTAAAPHPVCLSPSLPSEEQTNPKPETILLALRTCPDLAPAATLRLAKQLAKEAPDVAPEKLSLALATQVKRQKPYNLGGWIRSAFRNQQDQILTQKSVQTSETTETPKPKKRALQPTKPANPEDIARPITMSLPIPIESRAAGIEAISMFLQGAA